MTKTENFSCKVSPDTLFIRNYYTKIYDLYLLDIYASPKDAETEICYYDSYFENHIIPYLLQLGGTKTEYGVTYQNLEYLPFSKITSEYLTFIQFEQKIRTYHGLGNEKIEQCPQTSLSYAYYDLQSDNVKMNQDFYKVTDQYIQQITPEYERV